MYRRNPDWELRDFQRKIAAEQLLDETPPLVQRYIRALERNVGMGDQAPTLEETRELIKTANRLRNQAGQQLAAQLYANVATPVNQPVTITWNLPVSVRFNYYMEYPPYAETDNLPANDTFPGVVLQATSNPLKFDIYGDENMDDPANSVIYRVPRWAFRISDDELEIFNQLREYLPAEYRGGRSSDDYYEEQ